MKYELGQVIWYILNDKVCSAPILSRMCVENLHEDWIATKQQRMMYARFGMSGVYYATCHINPLNEEEVYPTKEDLLNSL